MTISKFWSTWSLCWTKEQNLSMIPIYSSRVNWRSPWCHRQLHQFQPPQVWSLLCHHEPYYSTTNETNTFHNTLFGYNLISQFLIFFFWSEILLYFKCLQKLIVWFCSFSLQYGLLPLFIEILKWSKPLKNFEIYQSVSI